MQIVITVQVLGALDEGLTNQIIVCSAQGLRYWAGRNDCSQVQAVSVWDDAGKRLCLEPREVWNIEQMMVVAREIDRDVGNPHIVDDKFQSDKFPTTPRGLLPLSLADPMAQDLIDEYARRRRKKDPQFSAALIRCLKIEGYERPSF